MSQLSLRTPSGGTINITAEDTAVSKTLTLPAGDGEVFNQSNILGTVSESAGVPTGAIIERGGNTNGTYIKFADGTLICLSQAFTAGDTIISTSSGVSRSSAGGRFTWTFPSVFSSVRIAHGAHLRGVGGASFSNIVVSGAEDLTQLDISLLDLTGSNTSQPVRAWAIGEWQE